jgi:hypothetical protein
MKSGPAALELMGRYLDGQATAEETARLEAMMMADPQLRSEFLACARVEASLRTALVGKRVPSPRRTTRWRQVWIPLAAAAALVIGAFVFYPEMSERLGHPAAVARFGQLDACRWMDPATRVLSGDGIAAGERVELSAGRAELHFATGARVTLLGPAIFELRSKNGGFLTLGEVRVAAETVESKGFVLATPTSNFVDIGTAFSAGVSADGLSRLEVSEGIVDVVFNEHAPTQRLRAGETMFVEPGEKKILTRIEAGDGTAAFRFPTIPPPSADDEADLKKGLASIRVTRGRLGRDTGRLGGSVEVLLDGAGQSKQDAPRESAYFSPEADGAFVVDLGRVMPVRRIHSYSWHQHEAIAAHRERAKQRFTLYAWTGDAPPDFSLPPEEAGWTRIARVNTDESLHVEKRLDRPAQQACAITAESGDIGPFRYLLWEVQGGTFYGEIDVFSDP